MTTISADKFVDVQPGVLSAGGTGLVLQALVLSTSTRVPIGTVKSFSDGPSVTDYFGGGSAESLFAEGGVGLGSGYFGGFDGSVEVSGLNIEAFDDFFFWQLLNPIIHNHSSFDFA